MEYLHETVDEFDLGKRIRFGHEVFSAAFCSEKAQWTLHLRDRLLGPGGEDRPRGHESLKAIEAARQEGADGRILHDVEAWTRGMAETLGVELPATT